MAHGETRQIPIGALVQILLGGPLGVIASPPGSLSKQAPGRGGNFRGTAAAK